MNHKPFIIVVSAPSGAGKTTILKEVRRLVSGVFYSVSATTRPPRPGEVDGVDYIFVTKKEFERMIESGDLLEWAKVFGGEYYGTPKSPVIKALEAGMDVLMDLDIQGKESLEAMYDGSIISIFLLPPSFEELRRRLNGRKTENESELQERLSRAKVELKWAENYQYWVISSLIDEAAKGIVSIINAERMRRERVIFNLDID
ncbi:MAG TPA: guanylate kinase [Candidatus Hydrothermia bacterium]|nr:guanylate kinase [Candidatus Hydrothermae bacterium]MDD3649176.1 guanylate kinase [Candidatus Hydrothermia bacterium]MDD5572155.1 guanylate kinase [Candidatus Hydrothermia bacterium]HOK23372.1 guanylate kinase [Candidatus Hydrothermia bacterium]HOL24182.1 guanylate kinase [Candidatus Hydrothermia bacterium]